MTGLEAVVWVMIISLPRERVTIFEQSDDHQAMVCANAET
jgi:hypothetical protein